MARTLELTVSEKPALAFTLGVVAGTGMGVAIGYLTSPHRGSTTRNLIANQLRHYAAEARKTAHRAEARGRDLRNRAIGLAHDLRQALGVERAVVASPDAAPAPQV